MYLFLATLGLHHCMQASSAGEWGLLELWCAGFSLWWLRLLQSAV